MKRSIPEYTVRKQHKRNWGVHPDALTTQIQVLDRVSRANPHPEPLDEHGHADFDVDMEAKHDPHPNPIFTVPGPTPGYDDEQLDKPVSTAVPAVEQVNDTI